MPSFVYLIRNDDLYKIGRTDNLVARTKKLLPGVLVSALETDRSRDLEHELHKKYKHRRLPQSEYFRLTLDEVDEVLQVLKTSDEVAYANYQLKEEVAKSKHKGGWRFAYREAIAYIIADPDFETREADYVKKDKHNFHLIKQELMVEFPERFNSNHPNYFDKPRALKPDAWEKDTDYRRTAVQ